MPRKDTGLIWMNGVIRMAGRSDVTVRREKGSYLFYVNDEYRDSLSEDRVMHMFYQDLKRFIAAL